MVPAQVHLPAWTITSRRLRHVLLAIAAGTLLAATAAAVVSNGHTGAALPPAFEATNGAHVTVSALPGVDLRPVLELPGLSAASGPFPTVVTGARHGGRESDLRLQARPSPRSVVDRPLLRSGNWGRAGGVVLEQRFARALRVTPGSRITVSSASGPTSLRVAGTAVTSNESHGGTAPGVGYVTPRTLARLVPNRHTYGSTLYLRVSDPDRSQQYIDWIRRSYPAAQVTVEDWHRLERPAGAR